MSALETRGREIGAFFDVPGLMQTDFPEPRWAVPGLIPEGLTLLAGAPKFGKSWFTLGMATSIALGNPVLGTIPTQPGDVLVASLEDPPRRLKQRLTTLLDGCEAPARMSVVTQLPLLLDATALIGGWLDEHPDARLVVVDVLAKIRPAATPGSSMYEVDYRIAGELKRLADAYGVAIVCVTHVRKMGADDPFDRVSGSTGLTGAADCVIVLDRNRSEHGASMHITGRDVLEAEYAITFNPQTCQWRLDGGGLSEAAGQARVLKTAQGVGDDALRIIALVAKNPDGIGPTEVGRSLAMPANKAGTYLQRLEESGRVRKITRGRYAPVESVESVENGGEVIPINFHTHNTFNTPPTT